MRTPSTQSLDSHGLLGHHASRALLYRTIADLLDAEGPSTLRASLRQLARLGAGGSPRAHLETAAGLLGEPQIVGERHKLLAGELGEVALACFGSRPCLGAPEKNTHARIDELRALERMASSCAEALERSDIAHASEAWDEQSAALEGPLGRCLGSLVAELESSNSPFYREVPPCRAEFKPIL